MSETGKKSRSHRRSLCCLIVVVSLKQMILCFQLMTLSEFLRLRLQGLITTLIKKQCHICSNYLYYQIVYDNQYHYGIIDFNPILIKKNNWKASDCTNYFTSVCALLILSQFFKQNKGQVRS